MMEAFALYLFKSVVWLSGFTVVFFIFLRNERFFTLNRLYLLSGIATSLLLPLLTITYSIDYPVPMDIQAGSPEVLSVLPVHGGWKPGIGTVLITLYLIGAAIIILLFAIKSKTVIKAINKAEVESDFPVRVIRSSDYASSFSFFSYVFVNPSVSDVETREIVNHEMVHISQKHWADLVFAEILCILQWFNPLSWVYIHFIRQNHEYLADAGALQRSPDPAVYRAALLNQVMGMPVFTLSNSFNYSLTKKRFKMMKNIVMSPYRKMRILFILPVMAAIMVAFARPEYKYTTPNDNPASNTSIVSDQDLRTVKGVVVQQDGKPLEGAAIVIKSSTVGTTTDAKGSFSLSNVPADGSLAVTFVGYKSKVVKPLFNASMKIEMVRDTIQHGTVRTSPPPSPPPPPSDKKDITTEGNNTGTKAAATGYGSDKKVVKQEYVLVEEMPYFPGGEDALMKYISENVKYPAEAVKGNITGTVFVDFIVDKNGKISNARVSEPVHPLLDAEAVRVISSIPAWKPGSQAGKPEDVYLKLPIEFKLK